MSQIVKLCSCGVKWVEVPFRARVQMNGDDLDGFYWECRCGSTMFVPQAFPRKASRNDDSAQNLRVANALSWGDLADPEDDPPKKKILPMLIGALLLVGCGSDPVCSGKLVGAWVGASLGDELILTEQCTFANDLCESKGSVEEFSGSSGSLQVTIDNDPALLGCLEKGDHTCTYSVSSDVLSFTCGGSAETYNRK